MTDTSTQSKMQPNTKIEAKTTSTAQPKELLSDFGLINDLYLSLNYHNTMIDKAGMMAKFKKKKVPLDIDLACVLYDQEGKQVDMVWFKKLRDDSEAIRHHGDQLHGYQTQQEKLEHRQAKAEHRAEHPSSQLEELSPSELEYIHLNLAKLPKTVHQIAILVSSFQHSPMSQVSAGQVKLEDVEGNIAMRVDLTHLAKDCCSLWLASLLRVNEMAYHPDFEYEDWQFVRKQQPMPHDDLRGLASRTLVATTQ